MGKMLTHESIAQGCWNRSYCSANQLQSAWETALTNTPQILDLAIERMTKDYSSLNPKMRKAYGAKDIDTFMNR